MAIQIPGKRTEPAIPILDRRFVYTPASATDIRKTFERVRAQQQAGTFEPSQPSRSAA
jgi:hypothetical protein